MLLTDTPFFYLLCLPLRASMMKGAQTEMTIRIISTTQMGRTNRVPRVAERELLLSSRAWDSPASAMGPKIRPSTMGTTLYL